MKRYYVQDKRGELVEVDQDLARELVRSGKRKPEDFRIDDGAAQPAPIAASPPPRVEAPFTNYGRMVNEAAARPQMVLPGGRIAQAPAVGVFADPVSPESMGARVTLQPPQASPVRPQTASESTAVRRLTPAARSAAVSPVWAEEQARRAQMAQPTLTEGQRAAQEERALVAQHEAEYQDYVKQYDSEWEADKKNRSGRAILDYRLSSGKRPLTRDEFARAKSGYSVPEAWMPGEMAGIATRERTPMQAVGEASEFLARTAMAPAVRAIDAAAGVAPGFSDLSHASNVRRNFETQARVQDFRNAESAGSALTEGEAAYLDENDPNVVVSTVRALKGLPDMAKELWDNPEALRQFGVSMAPDLLGSLALSGGASVALDVVKAGKNMRRMRNVVKSLEGRVAKGTMTTEQAAKGIARFKQTEDGAKAIEEMWQAVRKNPGMASGILKETLGDGLADAVIETINGQGRGEQTGIIENLISGMPIDIAPYLAINAGKRAVGRAVNGPDNGLNRADFDAARSVLELAPTIENKMGVPVMPGHVLDENGNVVMNTKKGKEQYALTQKAGSTATRPQVEAAMQRPDLKDRMRDLAAMARNPETADMKYRLGNEDISLDLTPEELRAASYGNREGSQTVNGYNQQRKGYEYAQNDDGTIRSVETQRPVAHITRNGGASTIAHETIHGIEDKVRKIGMDAAEGSGDAKFLDMVDDWTERAYEWGKRHGVILPGQKELLTHAMTYRLGHDGDYDASIAQLPVPDDLVREFSKRGGAALVGPQGLRLDGTIIDDMPLPEKSAQREAQAEPQANDLEGIEIPELDEGEELPFSFAGKRAANADLGKLAEAEDRLDAMEDRDKVRKATGWFRGADGKMRFEVDDSGVDLQKPFPKQGQPWGMIHDEMFKRDVESGSGKYGPTVGDVLGDAPILREYPEFREMGVSKGNGTGGAFIRARDGIDPAHIEIGENVPMSNVRSILLHEIQHAIQGQEGFARGGSPYERARIYKNRIMELERQIEEINKQLRASVGTPLYESLMDDRSDIVSELQTLEGPDGFGSIEKGFSEYKRFAGETEARNTQTRRDLTADHRRESAPWDTQDVKDGEQIVRFSLASDAGVPEHRADDPATIELARKQWAEKGVESPFFKKWFGDSKVVDEQGNPLVVYHGSKADFNIFDLQRAGRNGQAFGIGFYFTNSESIASGYGNTNSFYLKMNNPALSVKKKTITRVQVKKIVDILEKEDEYLLSNYGDVSTSGRASVMNDALNDVHGGSANDVDVITSLINMSGIPRESVMNAVIDVTGKDGLFVPADISFFGAEHGDNVYVALLPTQIKSATGNRGTFESENPDIRFSLASDAGIPEGRANDPKVVEAARKAWNEKGVDSPWFKRWFGDSKVVDRQGKPLAVYHGTVRDFTEFGLNHIGSQTDSGKLGEGFYFSSDHDVANFYANNAKANKDNAPSVKPVFVSIKNPIVLDNFDRNAGETYVDGLRRLSDEIGVTADPVTDSHTREPNKEWSAEFATQAMNHGYDGVIFPMRDGSMEVVAFSPTQIKSATGNRGTFDGSDADIRYSLAKSDPRQKILSHVTRAMRENGLKPMAQNDMSSEWRTFSKKAKADPVQRAKEVKAWDAVEESLRRFVADNPAIAAEAGLKPPAEGHLDDFNVQGAIDQFRVWTNSSTQGKHTAEELDHFAQARDAAQNGPGATEYSDHPMTKRSLLSIAKTHKMGNMIRFKSLGEKFNAEWAPEKKAWVVTRAGGKESFELPRDGSVWVDGARARAPEFDEDAYPLRDDRNLRAANAEQTAMGEGDLEKTESEESRLDALARHVQDSMRDLRKLQERVKNKEADPYREYDLAAGRGDHSGAKMREKFLRPILQLMEKHDLDQNVVDSYLYARHAAERNKSVAEKNPDFQDGGSGMKTKDAEEILRNFAQDAVRNQALETIGKISDKLNEWRLDMQVKAGLLSEVDAKAMQAAWKHYVPLRGIPGDEDARPGVFRGKVAKQDNKKAMGRKSKAESVLSQNFAVTLDAIVNSQRNIAARELWKMAGANPDPKYWELDPSYVRNVQGKDGQVTQMADLQRMQKAPGIVPVFIKGEPHYIEFKTPEGGRIAAAIKELNQEQSNTLIRGLGKVNRFVGSMITQYSPEFVLTNFSRDYLTALTVAFARDGVKIARRMVTQAPAAVVGLARSEMGLRNDWTDWKERCENAGGKVGFMQSKDFKSLADDIEDDLKDLTRSNYNPKKWANVVGKVVESANGSVESATRLAYFRALVENGVDEKVAAQKYKELTVNFNRRGDWKWANQFWMFFNASVQGSANIAKLFTDKNPEVRKRAYAAAGAIASAGAAVALYNQFLGGEDEDSGKTHYERMPGWAKNNAAVLLNPKSKDGSALTIPLPYGLNVIWNTGRMMAEGASRQDGFTAMDAASEIAGSIVGSFSPFGADIDPGNIPGTLLGLATPTAAKPWMELALNKNFAGRPVMPENIPGMVEKPESELYFHGVNPYARELAAFLNTETGGDKWHAGNVSVSPEKMEHVFNAYTGGVGRILQQGLGIAKTWGEGNETTIRQWPFARRFFSSAPEGVDRSAFMDEVLNPAKQDMAQLKDLAKSEDADVDQFVDEHYANIVASAAFGGLKTKEKRLKRAEELGEQIGPGGVKDEYRSFFAKAWKAKREMDALQEEHNSTTDQAKRAELRKRIEKEAEKAFEGFGE